jgi:hypothetical protein
MTKLKPISRIEPGHMHMHASTGVSAVIFVVIIFILFAVPLSAGSKPNMARKIKLDPAFDVNAYIHHVNTTIGGLLKELQQVQGVLADMQRKHGKGGTL